MILKPFALIPRQDKNLLMKLLKACDLSVNSYKFLKIQALDQKKLETSLMLHIVALRSGKQKLEQYPSLLDHSHLWLLPIWTGVQLFESAAWAVLHAQAHQSAEPSGPLSTSQVAKKNLPCNETNKTSESSAIPPSLLAVAPHLANLQAHASVNPYLAKTWELHQEYGKEKVIDSLVSLAQLQRVKDPVSKLYVTLDKDYDHYDEPKDFAEGFSLVRKDHTMARRSILMESDWTQAFDAWMVAVLAFYPHREAELVSYCGRIVNFFCSLPGTASIAIRFDCDMRDRYARNPFCLDNQNELQIPFLSQLLSASASVVLPVAGVKQGSNLWTQKLLHLYLLPLNTS
ncbi:hypothetical protein C0993_001592 [Termitomyces sp. T159_Od127]|nr:hypothetical protein C0993_001592 [Termitomyces sp. T159_Od127]